MLRRLIQACSAASGATTAALSGVTLLAMMACSNSGAPMDLPDLSVLPPDLTYFDAKAPEYPPGPYGSDVNKVMPNFTFQGYWSPKATFGLATAQPFGEVTFEKLRASGARYGLVQLAAFW